MVWGEAGDPHRAAPEGLEDEELMDKPTDEELARHDAETRKHKALVATFLGAMIDALRQRAIDHDDSKLVEPERSAYAVTIPKLKGLQYGTPEHRAVLGQMRPAIQHHQQSNRHHPEYHPRGTFDMNLVDLVEMVADWRAAALRGGDDFRESMKVSAKRFGLSPELASIIVNTADLLDGR